MSEVVFDAIAEKEVPQRLLDVFTPIVDEAKLHFNDDGIHTRAVGPSNVAMAYVDLSAAAFASYDSPGTVTQGANLHTLDERLSLGDTGDLVNLSLDMETRTLAVDLQSTDVNTISQSVALINPDSVRQEPDLPEIELPNQVVLTGKQLDTVATAVDMVSDHIDIIGDEDGGQIVFVGEGDTDDTEVDFGREELGDPSQINESVGSLFSMDYFEKAVKPIPNDTEVTVEWGDNMPVRVSWTDLDGHLDVQQNIAPRIRNGG